MMSNAMRNDVQGSQLFNVIASKVLLVSCSVGYYANTPMQYTAIFHGCKNVHFQLILFYYFHIFAQNIYCGYTLEPPQ